MQEPLVWHDGGWTDYLVYPAPGMQGEKPAYQEQYYKIFELPSGPDIKRQLNDRAVRELQEREAEWHNTKNYYRDYIKKTLSSCRITYEGRVMAILKENGTTQVYLQGYTKPVNIRASSLILDVGSVYEIKINGYSEYVSANIIDIACRSVGVCNEK